MTSRLSSTRAALLRLGLAALLLRALVPAGFMAAPLSEGWPLTLCPSGMAPASFLVLLGSPVSGDVHGAHDTHDTHDTQREHHGLPGEHAAHMDGSDEPPPACGLSAGYSAIAPLLDPLPADNMVAAAYLLHRQTLAQPRAPPARYLSRAPPFLS